MEPGTLILVVGLAVGVAIGFCSARLIGHARTLGVQFAPVATLAAGAVGFGLADVAGGSGFLAVYVVGLCVGNTATPLRCHPVSRLLGLTR